MATGYTVTPSSATENVGQISPAYTFAAVGGNFSHLNDFIVTSNVASDVLSVMGAGISSDPTPNIGLINPNDGPSFQLFILCTTPGPRTLTITNGQSWSDVSPLQNLALPLPIVELLTEALVTSLSTLTEPPGTSGYNTQLSSVVRGTHTPGPTPADLKAVVFDLKDDLPTQPWEANTSEAGTLQHTPWVKHYQIFTYVLKSETDPNYDQYCNVIRSDIEKVLLAEIKNGTNLGGYCQNLWAVGSEKTWDANDVPGISVFIDVQYRTNQFDPYSLS